jgi:hypothetical protein
MCFDREPEPRERDHLLVVEDAPRRRSRVDGPLVAAVRTPQDGERLRADTDVEHRRPVLGDDDDAGPVAGSAVNMTPERSEFTIRRTSTEIAGSSPRMFVNVSFIPANDIVEESSPTADERTATNTSDPNAWYAARISSRSAGGTLGFVNETTEDFGRVAVVRPGPERVPDARRAHGGDVRVSGDREALGDREAGTDELAEVRALASHLRGVGE